MALFSSYRASWTISPAAIIGGTVARHVFRGKVHMGYLAAIVAASNAGGAGSVVGDTTTTMMWVAGVSPLSVLEAYVAAIVALLIFAIPAALQQERHSPIVKHARRGLSIDWARVFIVAAMLIVALVVNVVTNLHFPELLGRVPVLGLSLWIVLFVTAPLRRPDWGILPETFKGTIFLLALVTGSLNDACREAAGRIMADNARFRVFVSCIRQYTADGSRAQTRWL